MIYFTGNNFSKIYYEMLYYAIEANRPITSSRVGPIKDLGPCVYQIKDDRNRLCYLKDRAINPFFALAEFSWIITGSNQLAPLQYFISSYEQYSDDKQTLHGAYGYRLKYYFNIDQIEKAIEQLRRSPSSRRVVLTMWSHQDLLSQSLDIPCNTQIYLKIRNQKLDITITNRSNDLYMGVPYNVLIFYLLQLYIAKKLQIEPGTQTHYTDSLHLYEKHFEKSKQIITSTTLEEIISIGKAFHVNSLQEYLNINHSYVVALNFQNIHSEYFENFFKLFQEIKKNKMVSYTFNFNNLLDYLAYNWLYTYKKNFQTQQSKKVTNFQIDNISSFKYLPIHTLKKKIQKFCEVFNTNFDDFIKVLQQNNQDSVLSVQLSDKEKILRIVILSLILESISANLYNKELRKVLVKKIESIAIDFKISLQDLYFFNQYNSEWQTIIDKKDKRL